jgi:manganese/zinc/iron transport system substrate-binding protein
MLILFVALLTIVAGCNDAPNAPGSAGATKKPRVVATTTFVGDLVRQIASDRVDLQVIMPAGVDPHSFKPSTGDLGAISRADLVFFNGLHLEGKMVELLEHELKDRAVAITRDVKPDQLLPWEAGQTGAYDPHIWFDARLWAIAAQTVGDALSKLDPTHASEYQQRTQETVARLNALHEEMRSQLATVPKEKRVLITSHDAYNYFGRAYDVEVRGLQGISTETEAGLTNIQEAVDFIIARKIPAIFVESSVSPKTIERVQADCKSRGFNVKIGGELYSDAMGAAGEHPGYAVETYDGMFRYNVETMVKALGSN